MIVWLMRLHLPKGGSCANANVYYKLAPTVVLCAKKKTRLKYLISKLLLNCANSTMDDDKVYIELSFYSIRGPEKAPG